MRADLPLLIATALVAGGTLSTAPWPALLAFGVVLGLLLVSRALRASAALLMCLAFALGGVRAGYALAVHEGALVAAREWIAGPQRCAASGRVVGSPAGVGEALGFDAELHNLDCEGKLASGPLRARLYGGPSILARGDRFDAVLSLAAPQTFHNHELQDPRPRSLQLRAVLSGSVLGLEVGEPGRGLAADIDRARAHARARIAATFSPKAVPLAHALVLGQGDLDPEDAEAFRQSGLAHLLAVSGTHLVFAVLGLLRALRYLLLRCEWLALRVECERVVAAFGVLLAPLYADFAGGSGSAWRAAWMLSAGLLARALARRAVPSRALAASLLVGSLYDPVVAYDISFLLSLAATAGLLTVGQRLQALLGRTRFVAVRFLQTAALATFSAMLPCLPLLALMSSSFTWASIGANVIAAPLGEAVALPLCLLHGLTAFFPALELGIARVASGALLVIAQVAHASAQVSWLRCSTALPSSWQLAALAVAIAGALLLGLASAAAHRCAARVALLGLASSIAALGGLEWRQRVAGAPSGVLRITAVDVGQGDATLIDLPRGGLMLVDGGGIVGSRIDPGRRVLEPLLRTRRRQRIDVMVLSHPHPDHFLGLLHIAERFAVGELWDTGQGEAHGAGPDYARLLRTLRERGTLIRRPGELCGEARVKGDVIQVLAPCPGFERALGANDNSLVLRVAHGQHAALLMGDAEAAAERALLRRAGTTLQADFLKVGHHGSRTSSSPALLAAVAPRYASISCGVRNTFGHPHSQALEALAAQGTQALRTDLLGSITWQSDGAVAGLHEPTRAPWWRAFASLR